MNVVLSPGSPAELGFCPDRIGNLVAVFASEVTRKRLPGAVLLVARRGQLVLHQSVGQQDPQTGSMMENDAIFRIYSMTKPLVSVAAMMLVEQGKLLLTDPVAKYLSEFTDVLAMAHVDGHAVLERPKVAPTVHDLLRHTAGLTYEIMGSDPIQRQYVQARLSDPARTNREFSRAIAEFPLLFEPGSRWEYSRSTDVLGALIEVVSGRRLGELLGSYILDPLQMVDTGFAVTADRLPRVAEPFVKDPDGGFAFKMPNLRQVSTLEAAGGGLVSTAIDYARFLQCLLNGGALGPVRLLAPNTVRYMTADHLGTIPVNPGQSRDLLRPGYGFGLGFAVRTDVGVAPHPGTKGLYYWGGISGTTFFVDPVKELQAVMMIQAPNQRNYYRPLFRNLVYAALMD